MCVYIYTHTHLNTFYHGHTAPPPTIGHKIELAWPHLAALLPEPWGRSGILGRSAWAGGGYEALAGSDMAGGAPTSPL